MASRKPRPVLARSDFATLLADVKGRIRSAQTRAVLAVNAELVRLYWDIGRMIAFYREYRDPAAICLQRAPTHPPTLILPQAAAKSDAAANVAQPVAESEEAPFWSVPWFHHVILMSEACDRRTDHRSDPLPGARPVAGRVQLRRHQQAHWHLDVRVDAGAAPETALGPADGRGD